MSRREKRIVHQIEAEIDDLKIRFDHSCLEFGLDNPEAGQIKNKMLEMESMRDQAMKIFGGE